jgi:hypothetical protein
MTDIRSYIPSFSDMDIIVKDGTVSETEVKSFYENLAIQSFKYKASDENIKRAMLDVAREKAAKFYNLANTDGKEGLSTIEFTEFQNKLAATQEEGLSYISIKSTGDTVEWVMGDLFARKNETKINYLRPIFSTTEPEKDLKKVFDKLAETIR